jgi:hypothetical protein
MADGWPDAVLENKSHTRGQDNELYYPKIRGRVASLVATVAHLNSLMDMSKQWSLSMADVYTPNQGRYRASRLAP